MSWYLTQQRRESGIANFTRRHAEGMRGRHAEGMRWRHSEGMRGIKPRMVAA